VATGFALTVRAPLALAFAVPLGLGVGAIAGLACGLTAGTVLVSVRAALRRRGPASTTAISLAAGAGAALPPVALAGIAVAGHEWTAYVCLCFAALTFVLGALLGPLAAYGADGRRRPVSRRPASRQSPRSRPPRQT